MKYVKGMIIRINEEAGYGAVILLDQGEILPFSAANLRFDQDATFFAGQQVIVGYIEGIYARVVQYIKEDERCTITIKLPSGSTPSNDSSERPSLKKTIKGFRNSA